MKFLRQMILLLALIPSLSAARTIEFIVNVPLLTPAPAEIFLTGDLSETCFWKPDCLQLKEIQPGTFSVSLTIPEHQKKLSYKITRGSWDTEAADSQSIPVLNREIDLTAINSKIVHTVVHWSDLAPLGQSTSVKKSFTLFSKELDTDKNISVYLPVGYKNSKKHYPVIYMQDGHNVFDPLTSSFGMEWSIDETMDQMKAQAIVVAIHTNEELRYDEYNYYSKGKHYSDFVVDRVIPHIEKNYRAKKSKDSRFLMGSSMGALISLMMLVDRPDIFSKAAGLSMPAHIADQAAFRFLEHRNVHTGIKFYMDHGDWGGDAKYRTSAQELYQTLINSGMDAEMLKYLVFPYADHTEADWARRASIPLKFLLEL